MLSKVECIFFNVSAVRSTACMHLAVLAWVLDIKRKAEHTHTQDKHTHIIIKREAKHKHKRTSELRSHFVSRPARHDPSCFTALV